MNKEHCGLKLFIYDDISMQLLLTHSYPSDLFSLKNLMDQKYPNQKFGYLKLEDQFDTFNEICDENSFADALNNITGQGLSLKLKKINRPAGPWRCIRCQHIVNDPEKTTCPICKLARSN